MVRYRRGLVVLSSAGGNAVPVTAKLVQTSGDPVREMVHNLNKMGIGRDGGVGLGEAGEAAVPQPGHNPALGHQHGLHGCFGIRLQLHPVMKVRVPS